MNDIPVRRAEADYVLCWLQQTLRGVDNPTIDAAVALGNSLRLPVVVYHGIGQYYPHASDRLHQFILEASCSLEKDVVARGLRLIRVIEYPGRDVKGLLYRLATRSAALVVDDNCAFVGRWQLCTVASRLDRAVIAVDGTRLVPEAAVGSHCLTTRSFRACVNGVREDWLSEPMNIESHQSRFEGELATSHDVVDDDGNTITQWTSRCDIDHTVPPVAWCKGDRASALSHLTWAAVDVIPDYAAQRNNPAVPGVSYLSPFLHFGVLGPHEIANLVNDVESPRSVWKYLDEMLVWREYFHHQALHATVPDSYSTISRWARESLAAHVDDTREHLYSLSDMVHGRTHDETWNAAQRQFLIDGWMHNNLRMYWGKRIISWTATPEAAWATACYLNDRLSLDGRDPATYGNLRWCFGSGRPASEMPVYGTVARKSDVAMRRRPGMPEWLTQQANRDTPTLSVPPVPPVIERPHASGHRAVNNKECGL